MNSRIKPACNFLLAVFFVFAIISGKPAFAETPGYISDQLSVPMRTGASNEHRILKFLSSGTTVKLLENSEDDKYKLVEISDGKSGWVLADNIMDAPGARELLESANSKLLVSNQKVKELTKKITGLESELTGLKQDIQALQDERINLSNSIEDLKITSANPLALSKKNAQLKIELEEALANLAMLESDNQQLGNNVMQEWFIIGGGVSIGSLVLGIILTRINWRRKRDSWGDGF